MMVYLIVFKCSCVIELFDRFMFHWLSIVDGIDSAITSNPADTTILVTKVGSKSVL